MKKKLVICVGAPRSGTTLLYGILTGGSVHPILPECTYVTKIIELYHNIVNYSDEQRFQTFGGTKQELTEHFSTLIDSILTATYNRIGAKDNRLVLKDPLLTLYLSDASLFFPEAKYVAVVRNPLDVVASYVRLYKGNNDIILIDEIISEVFNYYYRIMLCKERTENRLELLILRYEDIVAIDKRDQIKRDLESFVGYHIDTFGFSGGMEFDGNDRTFSSNWGDKVKSNLVGRYKNTLSKTEIAKVTHVFSGVMDKFDYTN